MTGVAFFAALVGSAVSAAGSLLAQTGGAGTDLAPIVSGGGAVTAVGGIVYIARLMATGRLVARDTEERDKKLAETLDRVIGLAERAEKRESDYYAVFIRPPGRSQT